MDYFRHSLAEVVKGKFNARIFNHAAPSTIPDQAYLKRKRSSVFHKAFESSGQVMREFVPPVHQKSQANQDRLVDLLKTSFLTKGMEEKNLLVLAKAMFPRNFSKNECIIRYGDMGSEYFVLSTGKVQVTVY